jgi:two-component system, OmpR family, sensor histidine kinase QseC
MSGSDSEARFSLARRISIRVGVVALITSVIQLLVVVATHYFDYDDLALDHIRREVGWLARGLAQTPNGLTFKLPDDMRHYADEYRQHYAFRVLDRGGAVIASGQPRVLQEVSPWQPASGEAMPGFWFRKLDDQRQLHFAGGKQVRIGNTDVLIEMAVIDDPAGVHRWIVAYETLQDVWLPILPFTLLIPFAALFSMSSALGFLTRAAHQADHVEAQSPLRHLEFAEIPSEAAPFALAINRLLARVSALMHSYRVFMGSAAHELRTPLAAMLIELEKIDDPRARALEKDVTGMAESVNRLLTLVRLQATEPPDLGDVDVGAVVWDTINSLREWAKAEQHEIDLNLQESGSVRGDPIAIREAVRNLVENAVRHTPAGTPIRVSVGAECTITVEDGGPGLPALSWDQLFEPFHKGRRSQGAGLGLTIVRRAVDLHRGSIEVGRSPLGGAMFHMRFA